MQSSFRIARVAGVDIGANWSWLIVVALIVWVLSAGVFPEFNPGLSDETYLVMAAVAATLFFTSLLAHELGHATQAQREGVEIDGITLWIFGGVARFKGRFPSAGAEFRIAVAGPVVSLVLGLVFLAAALAIPLPAAVDGVVFWLGYINLILLGFNLLPALPLDGGRVLRAALWARKGDLGAATRTAARLGKGFGQVLIAWGLLVAIFAGAIGGLWLAFIGWFLLMAAEAEARSAEASVALEGLTVADVMVSDPVTTSPATTVRAFFDDVFLTHRHTAYPVTEDGSAIGLISFRKAAEVPREEWDSRQVRDCMVPVDEALVMERETPLDDALPELAQTELRRALVCADGRLLGLVSITDASRVVEALGRGRG